jgi:hypothetical protein
MEDEANRDASWEEVFLTAKDLAARWGVTRGWLSRARWKGQGPRYFQAAGPRGTVRYPLSAVLAFEAANMRRTTAPSPEPALPQGGSRHGS